MNKNIKMIKGKKIIGAGLSRVVYDLRNGYVLKVAKSKYGMKSNNKEAIIYRSAPSRVRKHLGTIINYWYGYRMLVMKKYNRIFPRSKKYRRKLFVLKIKLRKNGIIPHDLTYDNLRLKNNGLIVIIDYGNFEMLRKLRKKRI